MSAQVYPTAFLPRRSAAHGVKLYLMCHTPPPPLDLKEVAHDRAFGPCGHRRQSKPLAFSHHSSPLKALSRMEGNSASISAAVSACSRFSTSTLACRVSR